MTATVIDIFDRDRTHARYLAGVGRLCRDRPDFLARLLGSQEAAERALRLADDPTLTDEDTTTTED